MKCRQNERSTFQQTIITIDQRRQKGSGVSFPMFLQSQAPVARAAVTFTATFMAR
jgi:hypothetical protein